VLLSIIVAGVSIVQPGLSGIVYYIVWIEAGVAATTGRLASLSCNCRLCGFVYRSSVAGALGIVCIANCATIC
jgi:hypothetical protein